MNNQDEIIIIGGLVMFSGFLTTALFYGGIKFGVFFMSFL